MVLIAIQKVLFLTTYAISQKNHD